MSRIKYSICAGCLAVLLLLSGPAALKVGTFPEVEWTGSLSKPSKHTPEWIVYTYLYTRKKQLGIRDPRREMIVTGVSGSADRGTEVRLQRFLYGTPVWGDGLTFELDPGGSIRSVRGTIHRDLERQLFRRSKHPAISAEKAARIAREWLASVSRAAEITETRVYYLPDRPGVPLVYAVQTGQDGLIFVHALTGRVIRSNI
ncbi:hypothetical protein GE107_14760 [Cohnella sp. CFH 77786]|uniref:hypothetical protein n=1 Tax=Cohnella sp. CFH 77786 TaxID=2662265 RepID=UPI001C60B92D|nr:hypothetical protein [Cohnella sp. CFH 77786]MBW5447315.1 hypothetical protein [Cohnella sp. CFH 77786]